MRRTVPMRILTTTFLFLALAAPLQRPVAASPTGLPDSAIPDAFGTAIHFLDQAPATRANGQRSELDQLSEAAGFVRIDMHWSGTEPISRRGLPLAERYDFSRYDRLLQDAWTRSKGAPGRPLNVVFILAYNNELYWNRVFGGRKRVADPGKPGDADDPLAVNPAWQVPPDTPEERAGYARWAARAVEHFAALRRDRFPGMNIIWEIWNEPNITPFWGKRPNAADYAALVAEAAPAMRRADPQATIVVGALSNIDLEYAEQIARRGVLRDADAFSVHPYGLMPESTLDRLLSLRRLLDRHSPGRAIPIMVSEVGFYTVQRPGSLSELDQARYLVRTRLLHLSQGIRGTVYYDWKNDGRNPIEAEHNFGMVVQRFETAFPFDKEEHGTPRGLMSAQSLTWADALAPKPGEQENGKVADIRVVGFAKGDSVALRPAPGYEDELPEDAEAMGMWVYGDAGRDRLSLVGEDRDGNPLGVISSLPITWSGWRWITIPLNTPDPQTGRRRTAPDRWWVTLTNGTNLAHDAHIQVDDIGAFRPIFDPKPAYTAARVLNETLAGFAFVRTLSQRDGEFHVLLREREGKDGRDPRTAVALWSTGLQVCDAGGMCHPAHTYVVPEGASGTLVDMLGKKRRVQGGQVIAVGPSPQYILFDDRTSRAAMGNLNLKASWSWTVADATGQQVPLAWSIVPAGRTLVTTIHLGNKTGHPLRYDEVSVSVPGGRVALEAIEARLPIVVPPGGAEVALPIRLTQDLRSPEIRARVLIRATDTEARDKAERLDEAELPIVLDAPIATEASAVFNGAVQVRLRAQDGGLPEGPLTVTVASPEHGEGHATLSPEPGRSEAFVSVPMPGAPQTGSPEDAYTLRVRVSRDGREVARVDGRYQRGLSFDTDTPDAPPAGVTEYLGGYNNPRTGGTRPEMAAGRKSAVTVRSDPERGRVAELRLTFQPGRSYVSLIAGPRRPIPDDTAALGLWVNGDASGDTLSVDFVDRTGQTHQVRSGPVNWTGWRWLVLPLDDPTVHHWTYGNVSGPNDGTIRRPLRLETILGVDGSRGEEHGTTPGVKPHESHLQFDDLTYLSRVP